MACRYVRLHRRLAAARGRRRRRHRRHVRGPAARALCPRRCVARRSRARLRPRKPVDVAFFVIFFGRPPGAERVAGAVARRHGRGRLIRRAPLPRARQHAAARHEAEPVAPSPARAVHRPPPDAPRARVGRGGRRRQLPPARVQRRRRRQRNVRATGERHAPARVHPLRGHRPPLVLRRPRFSRRTLRQPRAHFAVARAGLLRVRR